MKLRINLSIRLLVFSLLSASAIILITGRVVENNSIKVAYYETKRNNDIRAKFYATSLKEQLEEQFYRLQNYSQTASQNNTYDYETLRPLYNTLLEEMAVNNPSVMNVWDSWELSYTNSKWTEPYGRVLHNFENTEFGVDYTTTELDLTGDDFESYYYFNKLVPEEALSNPEWVFSNLGNKKRQYATRLMVPHLSDGTFVGLCGIDYSLNNFQKIVDSLNSSQPYDITVFSFNGDIVAHNNPKLIGRNIVEVDTFLSKHFNIIDRIQSGESSNYHLQSTKGVDSVYYSLASVKIGNTNTPWAVMVSAPLQTIGERVSSMFTFVYRISALGLLILAIVVGWFSLSIVNPLRRTKKILHTMTKGEVHNLDNLSITSDDELGEIAQSTNTLVAGINHVTEFAESIGNGDYKFNFNLLSEGDVLGNSIIEMRNSLENAAIDEKNRQIDDANLNWASQGLNIFNRILRVDNQNLEKLTYEIIETLTNYMGAHMGGIYLKKDNNETIYELTSHIGFSKEKYSRREISPSDGTVGLCILEKESIFINEVPANYEKVGSGLGKSIPASILIVPLKTNKEMIGIIEIESLKIIEQHQVNFVEKLSESIASTINTVKINVQTATLLEKSQKQAEELEQQEEEMRQNMEEMQATQEEATKREADLAVLIDGYQQLLLITEYDMKQRIVEVNDNYLNLLKLSKSQVVGKQHHADLFMDEQEQAKHNAFWDSLMQGHTQESVEYIRSGKEDFWIHEHYLPVKDQYGAIQKVLCIGFDVTDERKIEGEIKLAQEGFYEKSVKKSKSKSGQPSIDLNATLGVVDLTYLKMVYKKDPHKIYNILKLYYDTLPQQVQELDEVYKQKDFNKLKSKINGLKTKMSYLGLKVMYEELRTIEKLITEGKNLVEIPKLLKGITKQWEIAFAELKHLLQIP